MKEESDQITSTFLHIMFMLQMNKLTFMSEARGNGSGIMAAKLEITRDSVVTTSVNYWIFQTRRFPSVFAVSSKANIFNIGTFSAKILAQKMYFKPKQDFFPHLDQVVLYLKLTWDYIVQLFWLHMCPKICQV